MSWLRDNQWLSLLVRVALGLVFLFSAWPKIDDPPGFAEMIWNYRILPGSFVNPLAMLLPWLELAAGVALVSGLLRKGAALLIGLLLLIFMAALATDLARGIAVDCGCFAVASETRTIQEMFASMKLDLLRDFGLALLAAQVLFAHNAQPRQAHD